MSQIDWSKAPEGATHKAIGGCWYRIEGDSVQFFNGFRKWSDRSPLSDYSNCWDDFIARPVSEEWTGEGLPPDGANVEIQRGECQWIERDEWQIGKTATVMSSFTNSLGHGIAAIQFVGGHCECILARCLAPIRTPEQIEAEARDAAIDDLMQIDDVYYEQAAAIYDRGYRKFEIVDE